MIARILALSVQARWFVVFLTAVVAVYSDQRTWELVGYAGPSFDKGGYLHRGFNDLDWLPDPEAAS